MASRDRPSDRLRQPQPLLRHRLPSGRGAMEQPNVTGDDDVPLTARVWGALLLTGIGAGVLGVALMLVLFTVADLTFGPGAGPGNFQAAVAAAPPVRRVGAV